jgi:hypothetical protein
VSTSRLLLAAVLGAALTPGLVPAQTTPAPVSPAASAVEESTDPARAAEVLKEARDIVSKTGGTAPAAGVVRGKSDTGVSFVSGGVTIDDRRAIRAERSAYNLWIATVAKRSGAYLSDIRLNVTRAGDKSPVLTRTMDGPWLLAALPAGRYEIVATMPGDGANPAQTIRQQVQVAKSGERQQMLRFDSNAEVSPDAVNDPFKGNPFGTESAKK